MKGFLLSEDELGLITAGLEIAYEDHEEHHDDAMALIEKLGGGLEGRVSFDLFVEAFMTQMASSLDITGEYLAKELKNRVALNKFTNPKLGEPYPEGDEK